MQDSVYLLAWTECGCSICKFTRDLDKCYSVKKAYQSIQKSNFITNKRKAKMTNYEEIVIYIHSTPTDNLIESNNK